MRRGKYSEGFFKGFTPYKFYADDNYWWSVDEGGMTQFDDGNFFYAASFSANGGNVIAITAKCDKFL